VAAPLLPVRLVLRAGKKFPKALFCIPQMQNPTCISHTYVARTVSCFQHMHAQVYVFFINLYMQVLCWDWHGSLESQTVSPPCECTARASAPPIRPGQPWSDGIQQPPLSMFVLFIYTLQARQREGRVRRVSSVQLVHHRGRRVPVPSLWRPARP
jgi:hypothetical protein